VLFVVLNTANIRQQRNIKQIKSEIIVELHKYPINYTTKTVESYKHPQKRTKLGNKTN
jgi:hypothetical protein